MRVVSFNIHHGTVGRRGPVDLPRLGEVCAAFEADVVALQEVDQRTLRVRGRDTMAIVAAATGLQPTFGRSRWLLGGQYGNGLLVRGQVLDTRLTRLPKVPGSHFWQEQRTLLEAHVEVAGRRLWVANTHLAVESWKSEPQLAGVLGQVAPRVEPIVVLGDLNRESTDVAGHAAGVGLSLVSHGPTFPARQPRLAIDHVLVSSQVEVVAAEVHPTSMSDHAALVVDVVVGAGPARQPQQDTVT